MKRSAKRDVAQDITNLIIRKIEEGTLPWRRPWKKTGAGGAPLRADAAYVLRGPTALARQCRWWGCVAYDEGHHLIANAGQSMWARFEEIENLELLRRLVEVNYLGVAHCIHAALPALRKSRGQVVVISSIQSKVGVPFHSGYSASKHALEGLVDTLRSELHGTGINFLQVYPDWIRGTGMRQNALGSNGQAVGDRKHDHGGAGVTVDECARAILRTMAKGRSSLYIPRKLQYVSCLKMFFPGLLRWGIRRRLNTQK